MGAEYTPALWMPADKTNYRASARPAEHEYDIIVIHCTDGRGFADRTASMWQEPGHKTSAHFVVGQDGTVVQAVRLADVAQHAHEANARSVGIEHCARTPAELGPDDPGLPPSDALYSASARLVAWLCKRAGLAPTRGVILGHAEADPKTTHTRCPLGCGWDWDHYISLVVASFNGGAV